MKIRSLVVFSSNVRDAVSFRLYEGWPLALAPVLSQCRDLFRIYQARVACGAYPTSIRTLGRLVYVTGGHINDLHVTEYCAYGMGVMIPRRSLEMCLISSWLSPSKREIEHDEPAAGHELCLYFMRRSPGGISNRRPYGSGRSI